MKTCQQGRVYAAEAEMSTKGLHFETADDIDRYVMDMVDQNWWWMYYAPVRGIEVSRLLRPDSTSVGAFFRDTEHGMIEMSALHTWELIVLHECAHVIAHAQHGSHAHDPYFAKAYLELVYLRMGGEPWLELRTLFDQHDVCYDERMQ